MPDSSSIVSYATTGNVHGVRKCIANGSNPNGMISGWAAMHHASKNNYPDVIEALIKSGTLAADANLKTKDGRTPLHIAAEFGSYECIPVLLRFGAQISLLNGDGKTAVEVADSNGHERVKKALDRAQFLENVDPAIKAACTFSRKSLRRTQSFT
eukprot:GFYU01002118.1.p1 GENE.GFYU01002118.1~~GFYU01002118.1.p1  ORF type:complete len:155 (-),score=32.90 GFYU01002118.1:221-685(-)